MVSFSIPFWIFAGLLSLACPAIAAADPSTAEIVASSGPLASSTDTWRTVPNTAFKTNEEYVFAVRAGLFRAGTAHLSVLGIETMDQRPAYHLSSEAHSTGLVRLFYPVNDQDDTWLDVQSLTTVRYEKKIRERHYRIEEAVTLDQVNHRYKATSYRADKGIYELQRGPLPPNVLDILGSFFYLRTQPITEGQSYVMDVFSGEKVWPLIVNITKRETVKVSAGKFDCFLVEPHLRDQGLFITKAKKLEVWLTADDRHMPVLLRAETFVGHVSASLLSYHPEQ